MNTYFRFSNLLTAYPSERNTYYNQAGYEVSPRGKLSFVVLLCDGNATIRVSFMNRSALSCVIRRLTVSRCGSNITHSYSEGTHYYRVSKPEYEVCIPDFQELGVHQLVIGIQFETKPYWPSRPIYVNKGKCKVLAEIFLKQYTDGKVRDDSVFCLLHSMDRMRHLVLPGFYMYFRAPTHMHANVMGNLIQLPDFFKIHSLTLYPTGQNRTKTWHMGLIVAPLRELQIFSIKSFVKPCPPEDNGISFTHNGEFVSGTIHIKVVQGIEQLPVSACVLLAQHGYGYLQNCHVWSSCSLARVLSSLRVNRLARISDVVRLSNGGFEVLTENLADSCTAFPNSNALEENILNSMARMIDLLMDEEVSESFQRNGTYLNHLVDEIDRLVRDYHYHVSDIREIIVSQHLVNLFDALEIFITDAHLTTKCMLEKVSEMTRQYYVAYLAERDRVPDLEPFYEEHV